MFNIGDKVYVKQENVLRLKQSCKLYFIRHISNNKVTLASVIDEHELVEEKVENIEFARNYPYRFAPKEKVKHMITGKTGTVTDQFATNAAWFYVRFNGKSELVASTFLQRISENRYQTF